jgi:hypothetical protein
LARAPIPAGGRLAGRPTWFSPSPRRTGMGLAALPPNNKGRAAYATGLTDRASIRLPAWLDIPHDNLNTLGISRLSRGAPNSRCVPCFDRQRYGWLCSDRKNISPAGARARSRAPSAQRQRAQDIGMDGARSRPSLDRGRRTFGFGSGPAHRAAREPATRRNVRTKSEPLANFGALLCGRRNGCSVKQAIKFAF